jgi:predicted dehydrogenase
MKTNHFKTNRSRVPMLLDRFVVGGFRPAAVLSRRSWLKGTAAGAGLAMAAPLLTPGSVLGKEDRPAPSARLTLGLVGLGSMGLRNLQGFLLEKDCQIVAVCDVDRARRRQAADLVNKEYGDTGCAEYNDFRQLIARPDIDLLCLSLPDHWHSIPAILGARAGKHIYGEKPLARTIREGRLMVEAIQRYGCVWQTGSWQRSTAHFRFACELVRNGRIGHLQHVEVGIGIGPRTGPQPLMPVPEGFDYEMWLGPAPPAPYTEQRCHWNFRWILDYAGGQVTDWGAHHLDIAQWGMGTEDTGPVEIQGTGDFPWDSLWNAAVTYRFECRYANCLTLVVASEDTFENGVRWVGDQGWVHVDRNRVTTHPERLLHERFGPEEIHLYQSPPDRQGHRRNFLDCVKNHSPTASTIEVAHRSVTVAHLGNIAMQLGRTIRWDPVAEQIIGDPTAARMLSRPMRGEWAT